MSARALRLQTEMMGLVALVRHVPGCSHDGKAGFGGIVGTCHALATWRVREVALCDAHVTSLARVYPPDHPDNAPVELATAKYVRRIEEIVREWSKSREVRGRKPAVAVAIAEVEA